MKKEDMLLMQNGTRKGFAMKIKTRLLGFKMVRFDMGAQGILIPRSVNNELEGKVDSIGDEDPAKNKSAVQRLLQRKLNSASNLLLLKTQWKLKN